MVLLAVLQKWYDKWMTWDKSDFNNVSVVVIPSDWVWLPDISLVNTWVLHVCLYVSCYYMVRTRKSSCVNARGIPIAAYQVLHLWAEVGYPPPAVPPAGVPLARSDGGYPPAGPGFGPSPPQLDLAQLPSPGVHRQNDGQNITFPRTSYAVGN